jgi:nucleotide-binding universal stress UspA family protein
MVAVGYPADKIIEVADSEKVDLIVMGNVGRTGLSRLMALGSVSRTVSEKARCPVMIVH